MPSIDDLPLDTGRDETTTSAPPARSPAGPKVAVLAVLAAVAVAAGVYFYLSWPRGSSAPVRVDAAAAPSAAASVEPAAAAPVLPPLAEMDPYVRSLFATLSSHPEFLKWLATDDLVGAVATAISRMSQGQSPSRDLAVLRPAQGFTVAQRGGVTRIDTASYARYAPLTAAVASVDPAVLATGLATLRPRLVEAWVAQGHSETTFDDAVRRAVNVVATTPDIPADAALVPGAGGYAYADPELERLPGAQKHLLRMGPEHVARVRDAARRFGAALAASSTR